MADKIVVADKLSTNGLALLRATPGLEVIETVGKPELLKDAMLVASAIIVRSETKVTAALMEGAPKLRLIARAGIGTDNIDLEEASRRGIPVLTAPGANSNSAAEHALGLMLAMVRKIPQAAASMAAGKWDRKQFEGSELRGKTLGVLGLGRIGTMVAKLALAFGMKVIAFDPFVPPANALALGVELLPLDDLLGRADILTLHLALTGDTRHLLNAERFARMKKGVLIVNAARGALIVDAALVAALESGQVGAAALDVFEPEPLPADSVLRKAPNLILTPHLGASTKEAQARVSIEIAESVRDALVKDELRGCVNLDAVNGRARRGAGAKG